MNRELALMSWVDFEEIAAETDLALVPVGAVEVYGPHMPQGTDGIVAHALSVAVAERAGGVVAPLVPVGFSRSLTSFRGTLSVAPDAVREYCRGIAESLLDSGLRRVLFVNGHLGNVPAIDELCLELAADGCRLAQVDVWRFIQPFTTEWLSSTEWKFGHAGEAMTAVILYLRPDLVRMDRAVKGAPERPTAALGLSRPYSYRELSPQGLLGDSTLGTPELGRRIFEATVDRLIEYVTGREFGG